MDTKRHWSVTVGLALSRAMAGIGIFLVGITLALVSMHALAVAPPLASKLRSAGSGLYAGTASPPSVGTIVAQVIAVFFGLLGIIFVALMVYGGFQWMTAAGDSEQVKKAQKLIIDAVIGVIILMSASFISYWVLYTIAKEVVG